MSHQQEDYKAFGAHSCGRQYIKGRAPLTAGCKRCEVELQRYFEDLGTESEVVGNTEGRKPSLDDYDQV